MQCRFSSLRTDIHWRSAGWRDGPQFNADARLVEVEANAEEDADVVILQFSIFIIDDEIIRGPKVAAFQSKSDVIAEEVLQATTD